MEISTDTIKALRDRTGVSVMQCKRALEESNGNIDEAITLLRARAIVSAEKKADRELSAGAVGSYIHDGTVGAMVLLSCETDFVAKNPGFAVLARELAMHVAAMGPEDTEALLKEPFIKDGARTVQDLIHDAVQKFGERVEITSYARLSVR